jgi:hypothetical protein
MYPYIGKRTPVWDMSQKFSVHNRQVNKTQSMEGNANFPNSYNYVCTNSCLGKCLGKCRPSTKCHVTIVEMFDYKISLPTQWECIGPFLNSWRAVSATNTRLMLRKIKYYFIWFSLHFCNTFLAVRHIWLLLLFIMVAVVEFWVTLACYS